MVFCFYFCIGYRDRLNIILEYSQYYLKVVMNIFSVVFSGKSEEGLRNGVEVVKCYLWFVNVMVFFY